MADHKEARSNDDVFKGIGRKIEITSDDDFLKIKETLTRVGLVTEPNKLLQICFILHKRGQYAIVHHKELLSLDGLSVQIDEIDTQRRDTISELLQQWKLCKLEAPATGSLQMRGLKVVPFREKQGWSFYSLYNIGRK